MHKHVLFIDRDGVRINDQWISVKGRRIPVAAIRHVVIEECPPDVCATFVVTGAVITSAVALAAVATTYSLAVRVIALLITGSVLTLAICTIRLRPRSASLRARHSGRDEILIEAANSTLVNQIGWALIRAREWNDARTPIVYRSTDQHLAPVASIALIAALGTSALLLTMCNVPGIAS